MLEQAHINSCFSSNRIYIVNFHVIVHYYDKSYEDYVQEEVDRNFSCHHLYCVCGSCLLIVHCQEDSEKRHCDDDFIYLVLAYNNDSYSFDYNSYSIIINSSYHQLRNKDTNNGDMVLTNLSNNVI